jgi:hypothetical protein
MEFGGSSGQGYQYWHSLPFGIWHDYVVAIFSAVGFAAVEPALSLRRDESQL